MSIQIIDNFNISVSKPIDDRFVVGPQSFYTDKNDIPYKYIGLRVWDLNDGVPYVWDGATWTSENSVSVSGSGSASYVPKFIGSGNSTVLGNSCIYVSGNRVGINNTSITTGYTLDVIGGVRSQGATGFSGVGTLLTNLNASNISTGTMSLARLSNFSSTGWILTSGPSQPSYINPYLITVGAASASTVVSDTNNSNTHYIGFFNGYSGNLQSRVSRLNASEDISQRQLTYKPSTGNLTSALITTGTFSSTTSNTTTLNISSNSSSLANPVIKFSSFSSSIAGIYHTIDPSLRISLSAADKLIVESSYVNFGAQSTGTPRISLSTSPTAALPSYTWYGDPNTGMYRSAADTIGFSTGGTQSMSISNNGVRIGMSPSTGSWIKTHVSGYVKFVRNSNGLGFGFAGGTNDSRGGVTGVIDLTSGISFVTGGTFRISIGFPTDTFRGLNDDNVVFAQFGLNDTSGNILYYCNQISGKVTNTGYLELRMDFNSIPEMGYNFRLNFIVQSL